MYHNTASQFLAEYLRVPGLYQSFNASSNAHHVYCKIGLERNGRITMIRCLRVLEEDQVKSYDVTVSRMIICDPPGRCWPVKLCSVFDLSEESSDFCPWAIDPCSPTTATMPQRASTLVAMTSDPGALTTAYALSLFSEYTHTLDTLPLDLSKQFADLRELDAVLSASMHTITNKVNRLVDMIERNSMPKEERLWLLAEIAEEAQRLKLGGEDKIRVACQAADGLKGHADHLTALVHHVPNFDMSVLQRRTVYPHVAPPLVCPRIDTPAKKRRTAKDDEYEGAVSRTPRRDRVADSGASSRAKNGNRARRNDRLPSPAESILSVTSHQLSTYQPQQTHPASRTNNRNSASTNKRARPSADPSVTSTKDIPSAPPASSHPSLPAPYASALSTLHGPGWSGPTHSTLQGPGMPVAHSVAPRPVCARRSRHGRWWGRQRQWYGSRAIGRGGHGVMIGCDDAECEREWFHLGCIGLEYLPKGTWYCDACKERKKNQRGARGGKRRSGGGARSGARVASASAA
ncbi:hypothetical protein EW146_g2070 [Bondarzewia mesenterica]|uniref:Chromatin modification-related protein n=1 Tax=Bondarzewia mesenterica TaxID=1095465 RepID=A0A4S4M1S4_9AGAM|nr:hypothetical protein EW146_g2070 [Bondarzewia mesenterica]